MSRQTNNFIEQSLKVQGAEPVVIPSRLWKKMCRLSQGYRKGPGDILSSLERPRCEKPLRRFLIYTEKCWMVNCDK